MPPIIHTIGRHLSPELKGWLARLRARAIVYSHARTADLLAWMQLAKTGDNDAAIAPAAIVWLQSRPGEFQQGEIDAAIIADPLAKTFLIAGTLGEGEPRSGKLLADVTRLYWHQGPQAVCSQLAFASLRRSTDAAPWITIHVRQLSDYQCLAGVCHALGSKTIWQAADAPAIASEPDIRLFWGWSAWQAWHQTSRYRGTDPQAKTILLLDFPRQRDLQRAHDSGIAQVLAAPCRTAELRQAINACPHQVPSAMPADSIVQDQRPIYRRTA